MKKPKRPKTPEGPKARRGAWTPWAQVLCIECDYAGLKKSPSAHVFASRLKSLASTKRSEEVTQPDSETLIGTCDSCGCKCWVRDDVALLQRLSRKSSELGAPASCLEQTGGMCSALSYALEGRRLCVSAMDGGFTLSEYTLVEGDEWWDHMLRTWDSGQLYENGAWKPEIELECAIEECARKVIEFLSPEVTGNAAVQP